MNRLEKLSLLVPGFLGGWNARTLYEHPEWWREWHVFELHVS
jgi:hypothetical protein